MKYVINTHALIWFLEGNSRLGTNANAILSNPDSQLVIPAITLAKLFGLLREEEAVVPVERLALRVLEETNHKVAESAKIEEEVLELCKVMGLIFEDL